MGSLTDLIGRHLYLDANVSIYAVEGYAPYEVWLRELFARIDADEIHTSTSELTLAEMLVLPCRENDRQREDRCQAMLTSRAGLTVVPIDRAILIEASKLRARTGVKLPDAIPLATASSRGCQSFLTNDQRLRDPANLPILFLSELAASSGRAE